MANKPPLLPTETLERVVRIATIEGRIVMILSVTFAFLSATSHDATGAIIGTLVAGTGAIGLHGVSLLRSGTVRGVDWLVRGQLLLLATMMFYCAYRITHIDVEFIRNHMPLTPKILSDLKAAGITLDEFIRFSEIIVCIIVGVVSMVYQGGMALFYFHRRSAIAIALADTEPNEENADDDDQF